MNLYETKSGALAPALDLTIAEVESLTPAARIAWENETGWRFVRPVRAVRRVRLDRVEPL